MSRSEIKLSKSQTGKKLSWLNVELIECRIQRNTRRVWIMIAAIASVARTLEVAQL